jgi:ABC-type multidrug transport system fused ATPase/permease subunit
LEGQRYEVESKGVMINISNLHFTYLNENGENIGKIYDNYSLVIHPGSIVALVGPSGSGKSTLFNLLTKLEDIESGLILLDGHNVKDLTFKDIQRMVSYVTQENYLFKGTFRDNLKYGNQHFECSDERLNECLKLTNAFDFVASKGGLDALINEKGSNLSGGEKQRLILARALIKEPRLLLLDEGTSGIDSESEKIIINNLANHRSNMTTILITHKIDPFSPILTQIINLRE